MASEPAGLDCGEVCTADRETGTQITLTAFPAENSVFEGCTGENCEDREKCAITLDQDLSIVASFAPSSSASRGGGGGCFIDSLF